jgi:predicted TIM-barrel fold metal-dependent hydrolase
MDRLRIKRSILSITSPGTHLQTGNFELAKQITRETNDEIATVCRKFPDRFKFFASLPLPDVEGSLEEIDRALELGAVGFALMTNAQGYYMGDSRFDPVFSKLNERKAVVFVHPTQCCSLDNPETDKPLAQYPTPMMEYLFDTTRAVVNLILSGTVTRNRELTFLVSHCGAMLPPLIERLTTFSATPLLKSCERLSSDQVKELLRTRFFFDLAGMPFPDLIHGFLRVGESSRLLYGSDYPYTPGHMTRALSQIMDMNLQQMFSEEEIQRIYSGNAETLGL